MKILDIPSYTKEQRLRLDSGPDDSEKSDKIQLHNESNEDLLAESQNKKRDENEKVNGVSMQYLDNEK